MSEHTKLPWKVEMDGREEFGRVICSPSVCADICHRVTSDADAALIVRAVNNHAALVAALELAEVYLRDRVESQVGSRGATVILPAIRTALAAAKA